MKICLKCNREFEPKKETAKFCSNSCRVMHYQKRKKDGLVAKATDAEDKMSAMYNAIMGAINGVNARNGQPPAAAVVAVPEKKSSPKVAKTPIAAHREPKAVENEGAPKSLDELKAMCPTELKGFDRSEWIATERQKYGI